MNNVRQIRNERGLNQIELYQRSGVWPSLLSYIERNFYEPGPVVKKRLAKSLRVSVKKLFPRDEAASKSAGGGRSIDAPAFSCSPKKED